MKKVEIYFILLISSFISACIKSKDQPGPTHTVVAVTITSLSISTGPYNSTVIINGTGFDTSPANNKVFFNGKAATVSAATPTALTVAVPLGAGTGAVTVSVNNGKTISGPTFTYQLSAFVSTLAGNISPGTADGTGTLASFNHPAGLCIDSAGNVYVADFGNYLIRKISPAGVVTTLAGTGKSAHVDDSIYGAENTPSVASFVGPTAIATDMLGTFLFITDTSPSSSSEGSTIRLSSAFVTGSKYYWFFTTAGNYALNGAQDGRGINALFDEPNGITEDSSGNLYVADSANGTIRELTASDAEQPDGSLGSTVTTIASGFRYPEGVAVDRASNVYVCDFTDRIMKISASGRVVTTIAGSGQVGSSDGPAASATFSNPNSVAVDAAGNIYVADSSNNLIRKIGINGMVTTIAGNVAGGHNDGIGTSASFNFPNCIAVDAAGKTMYIADQGNNMIRKIIMQ